MKLENLTYLLEETIINAIARFRKYDVEHSIALIKTNIQNAYPTVEASIRDTDQIIFVNKKTFIIIYQYTPTEGARAALQNLARKLNPYNVAILTLIHTRIYDSDINADPVIRRIHTMLEAHENENGLYTDEDFFENDRFNHIDFSDI